MKKMNVLEVVETTQNKFKATFVRLAKKWKNYNPQVEVRPKEDINGRETIEIMFYTR
jgi:hypothetical protein